MFNLRIVTKAELKLYQATILDLRERMKRLESERDHERKRAEASINLLLAKTQNAVITAGNVDPDEVDKLIDSQMDIWGDAKEEERQRKALEDIQS